MSRIEKKLTTSQTLCLHSFNVISKVWQFIRVLVSERNKRERHIYWSNLITNDLKILIPIYDLTVFFLSAYYDLSTWRPLQIFLYDLSVDLIANS